MWKSCFWIVTLIPTLTKKLFSLITRTKSRNLRFLVEFLFSCSWTHRFLSIFKFCIVEKMWDWKFIGLHLFLSIKTQQIFSFHLKLMSQQIELSRFLQIDCGWCDFELNRCVSQTTDWDDRDVQDERWLNHSEKFCQSQSAAGFSVLMKNGNESTWQNLLLRVNGRKSELTAATAS